MRSLLEKSAYEAIAGLTLTANNYGEAVSILKKRFGDKNQIVTKHMDALMSTESVASSQNLKGLRHLYDTVESHIRSLKTLGVTSESYGSLLAPVLMKKLPQELRLIISRKVTTSEMKLDELLGLMEQELIARELTATNAPQPQPRRISNQLTAAALLSGATSICCFCQQRHASSSCKLVPDVSARKQILRKLIGRCFNYLVKGHISRQCRSRNRWIFTASITPRCSTHL